MKPFTKTTKHKPNDGYEPLTFKYDDVRKMAAKEQGEDLLRILIAGLQRKLGLPQTMTPPQASRPRKKVIDKSNRHSLHRPIARRISANFTQ